MTEPGSHARADTVRVGGRRSPTPRLSKSVRLLAFLAVGTLLYLAQAAFIPVAMALFLAILLTPAVDRLHAWRLPRGLAVLVVLLIVLTAAATTVNALWTPAESWLRTAPQTLHRIDTRVRPMRAVIARFEKLAAGVGQIAHNTVNEKDAGRPVNVTGDSPAPALEITRLLMEAVTVVPLTLFFMLGGPPLLARMGASLSGTTTSARALRLTEAIRDEVGRYFFTVALINLGLGVATAGALFALGMPNALLWGALAAVLNFVPYVGPLTTIAILFGAATVVFKDLVHELAVPGAFIALHLVEGQVVHPLTVGRRLELNALVILLAIWFGYWFWGVPGVVLAVPALVALKVAAAHEPSWSVVANFLAPNESLVGSSFRKRSDLESVESRRGVGIRSKASVVLVAASRA